MSTPDPQLFRARSSSRIVPIPTRQDPKSRQRVVRWKDIQLYFIDAHCVKHGEDVVLFLTDDDLEDLVPLRIAHHAGVVLEVLSMDDVQSESIPVATSSSTLALKPGSNRFLSATSLGEASSMANDVVALKIADTDTNQALVVRSHGMSSGALIQELPTMMGGDHSQSWTRSSMDQQEQLCQLQAQMEDTRLSQEQTQDQVGKVQEDLQQIQDQVDKIQGDLKEVDERTLSSQQEDVLQVTQQLNLQRDRLDKALQEMAQASHQEHERIDGILQDLQQVNQRTLDSQQELQQQREQMTQQSDQQRQHLDIVLHEVRQENQQTQHSQQKTQNQVEDVLQKMQKLGQEVQEIKLQVQNTQQLYEKLQQQIHDKDEIARQNEHSTPEKRLQETIQVFDRLTIAQHRVQATLATSYKDLSTPRLFIVLPEIVNVDGQEKADSVRFRLYFLCECGRHTMTEKSNNMHEVHFSNHSGYDLLNSHDFFQKYGSYLLTMMHMVKYGVETSGLLVPPLLGHRHPGGVGEQKFARLVDDTIVHILREIGTRHKDNNTAIRHHLTPSDLEQITSYLDVKGGGSFTGDLCRMTTQDRCIWLCDNHLGIERTLRQLKGIIDISGGIYTDHEVYVEVDTTSETLANQFKDTLRQLSMSQRPTGGFISCLDGIESLSIDFGRLSITIYGISQGKVENVAINIVRLGNLTMDDLDFIQQCHPVLLKIFHPPQEEDKDRLVNILQHNVTITELHIGWHVGRALTIINIVISARERLLQSGHQSALQTFRIMNGGMVPCDINSLSDDEGLVTATMSFTDGSTAFDMESHVKLRKSSADDDSVFIRHYGWSIKTLVAPFGDSHAELLDAITLERGSKIAIVDILSTSLTSSGLDAIDRVIKRAPSLPTIRLFLDKLHEEDQLEKAMILLERYKDRLISLRLNGGSKTKWLARITQALPTRDMFPLLEELTIDGQTGSSVFPANCQNWIVSMVSTPPSPLKQLKAFCLSNTYYYWDRIVRTMDLSALEVISFKGCTFFGNSDLVLLAERIVDGESQSRPFRRLDLSDCLFHDPSHCLAVFVMFREKGLLAKVVGLEDHLD